MKRTHGETHYTPESCFGCHVLGVNFAPSIFTTTPGGKKAAANKQAESNLVQDLDSFKRMRLAGLHPRSTTGARRVESMAESTFEVESGQLAAHKAKGRDARKPISKRGKEWRRRSEEAHQELKKGNALEPVKSR